jgi:Na+-transporting methylmalonyl-CoA/oxaloacetate decarboxylase gamma subunit
MDKWTFGITMTIVGVGGTFLTLWLLSLVMGLLKRAFPLSDEEKAEKKP